MDRRIIKTKKALKESLLSLLGKKSLEAVTVSEICQNAMVSRNTFYNYYGDKYALLQDCFTDYEENFEQAFEQVQKRNNPHRNIQQGFLNLIDTFMNTENMNHSIVVLSSFDLMELYYHSIMNILKKYEREYAVSLNPMYDQDQINSFLVLGFWGFIHGNDRVDKDTVRIKVRQLVTNLLDSPVFQIEQNKLQ